MSLPGGRDPERHVRVKQWGSVLNMLRRLDKIRFRGHKRDDFLDLAESPNASDNECGDDVPLRVPRAAPRALSLGASLQAGPGTLIMAAGVQDFNRTESDRLNEIKGHLEIALLEKHFLQEELRKLREETNSEMLRQELDRERQRRIELEQKVQEVLKARWALTPPSLSFRLTENMRRLKRGAKPVTSFVKNLSALSDWHSVYTSAIAFTVYMNAVWHGWAIPMFLFLAILRLSLNYLIARGWRIQWSIVPEVSEVVEPPKEDLTVSEKFQLVLDVAQKAQVRAPAGPWPCCVEGGTYRARRPPGPGPAVVMATESLGPWQEGALAVSALVTVESHLGIDTVSRASRVLPSGSPTRGSGPSRTPRQVQEAFLEEGTLACRVVCVLCENGWRCCLINRDRKMPTDYIRNGVLYVTENYLCFESSKSGSSKRNKVIRLVDITDIQKYKVLSVLPGSGMGIAVTTPSTQKVSAGQAGAPGPVQSH
ncbi:PREDICTED: GRAM domain-containing protein 4 [Myotis brandtii]|uniref:GRAM domain-containing protein 4 n=1 Tax=Myotis brandtii TaxID=109478 RepID=UPI00070449CA|nr:PREDICTED: GRAM domain-containing protein 4 [Myotis brandtii]